MRMSRNGFIIHFVISLKADMPYKATVVYNLTTVVYQLYITAQGFDVAHVVFGNYISLLLHTVTHTHYRQSLM